MNHKPVNYTLYNQKITFEFLKAHLWSAADILRGSLDPSDYRQLVSYHVRNIGREFLGLILGINF